MEKKTVDSRKKLVQVSEKQYLKFINEYPFQLLQEPYKMGFRWWDIIVVARYECEKYWIRK